MDKQKIEAVRKALAALGTDDLVRMAGSIVDGFERRIRDNEEAIVRHERFGRADRVAENERWMANNQRYLAIAQGLHDLAVEASAQEFARWFWAGRRGAR